MRRMLTLAAILVLAPCSRADDWPQWMGPQRDGVWRETGVVKKLPEGGPNVVWRAKIAGGYAGPAVADGRVFVADFVRKEGDDKPNPGRRSQLQGSERITAFDAQTGKELWKHEYDCPYSVSYACGPRCTPTVDGDRVYMLGTMGHLKCLNVADGKVVWEKDLVKEFKDKGAKVLIWGYSGHPLIDGDKLFVPVGGDGTTLVCFDKRSGKEIWQALSSSDVGYGPPTMVTVDGKKQLVFWHGEAVNGVDPESGKELWRVGLKPNFAMSIMQPRVSGDYLFVGGNGVNMLLKFDGGKAKEVYRGDRKKGLMPINATPFIDGKYLYGADQPGEFRAVVLETGERLWETFAPVAGKKAGSGTTFIVKNGDRFFLFAETGDLIIAKLSPKGYEEISRAHLLDPTGDAFGRKVVWSHPAYAHKHGYFRNDQELICVNLAE